MKLETQSPQCREVLFHPICLAASFVVLQLWWFSLNGVLAYLGRAKSLQVAGDSAKASAAYVIFSNSGKTPIPTCPF